MKNIKYFLLLFACTSFTYAKERITYFESDITINKDTSLHVKETIDVVSEGDQIRRGIVREIPTKYKMYGIFNYNVGFRIVSVKRDGTVIPYWTEKVSNGVKIYMAKKDVLLPSGRYRYELEYETDRQLGFFEHHDELNWNVTGHGWRLPIDKVIAYVHVPKEVSIKKVQAYTGYYGQTGKAYTSKINDHVATFETTRSFAPKEGLIIVVGMPKGYFVRPSINQKIYWFINDNKLVLFILLLIILIVGFILYLKIATYFKNRIKNIIPLFYPPKDMPPSVVGSMYTTKFKNEYLAADIIDLAVRGLVRIEIKQCFKKFLFKSNDYILHRIQDAQGKTVASSYDIALLNKIFGKFNKPKNISQANSLVSVAKWCLDYNRKETAKYNDSFCFFSSCYNQEGQKLREAIAGFRLYLKTAEEGRLQFLKEPPKLTPKLYEKYLPYAMVLGVEKLWTKKFEKLFKDFERKGIPYRSDWYGGGYYRSSSFASTFSSTISSASSPPGSSSGFSGGGGGGGCSGGGGGGGGC